jgi:hypothetical protein
MAVRNHSRNQSPVKYANVVACAWHWINLVIWYKNKVSHIKITFNVCNCYSYIYHLHRNILHEIQKRKANWIGYILRRNCLLKQVIEGKIKGHMEVTRRRGRRRKKLLDVPKDRRGYSHLKEEALDRTMWRNRFGRSFGPVVRQNTEWMIFIIINN